MYKYVLPVLLCSFFIACNQTNGEQEHPLESKEIKPINKDTPNREHTDTLTEKDIINKIRVEYTSINENVSSYKKEEIDVFDESTEGGVIQVFYLDDIIKKTIVSYYGEMGKSTEEFYFKNNDVFFVYTKKEHYNKPIYMDDSHVETTDENRFYFHQNKLVRWLDNEGSEVKKENYHNKADDLHQTINEFLDKIEKSHIDRLDYAAQNAVDISLLNLFEISPLEIFDETTEGLSQSEKESLLKHGDSDTWEITDSSATKLTINCKYPSSKVTFYFFRFEDSYNGILFAEVINESNTNLKSWNYYYETNTLKETHILPQYSVDDFFDSNVKRLESFTPKINYSFKDEKTIEASLYTWMVPELENIEPTNTIYLTWNGNYLEEKIIPIDN